jgi:hypothetical protein
MDYQNIYNQIIELAQNRELTGYFEKHHIIPKCLGGNNSKENLVKLTAREHFLCHKLLCEIYPKNIKLKYALFLMSIGKQKPKDKHYKISSREYERLKLQFSKLMEGNKTHLGNFHTQETKDKISKANSRPKPKGFGKKPEGFGNKISIANTGRKNSSETIQKMSNAKKGLPSKLKGRIRPNVGGIKSIIQYDLNNNPIKEWESGTKAAQFLNKGSGAISECCNGKRKTAYGYIWKFIYC